MKLERLAGLVILVGVTAAGGRAAAQESARATVALKKGDTVEGVFRGATATDVTVEIAGQALKIPIGDVRYVSFVGRVEAGPATTGAAKPAAGSAEDAFAALEELEGATRVGLLRAQYSEKVVATLPRVLAFADAVNETNPDLASTLRSAVRIYQFPLGAITKSDNPWGDAPVYWRRAGFRVMYAQVLAKKPPTLETPESRTLVMDTDAKGRLGSGDKVVPELLDKDHAGYMADVYQFTQNAEGKVVFTMTAIGCSPTLLIVDGAGKKIADKWDEVSVELKKSLKVGAYDVWATCSSPGGYTLKASVER
jgi:hypothetical protein